MTAAHELADPELDRRGSLAELDSIPHTTSAKLRPLESNSLQATERTDTLASRLLVDPGSPIAPHQLRVDELFALLRPAVVAATNRELARVQRSADNCPYIVAWLAYYETKPAQHVERAITHYAGGTASSAHDLVGLVVRAAVASVRRWIDTGQVTGIPGGLDPVAPAAASNPLAQLGPGTPMPAAVRAPAEHALGESLDGARLHTDAHAHDATTGVAARAFAIGPHVAFADGEFQPDTLEGALLLAHELAHVAQSRGTHVDGDVGSEDAGLEQNADELAIAIATRTSATARKRSGLRLQRCSDKETAPVPSPTPMPIPPAPRCVKPTVTVTRTGRQVFRGVEVDAVQPTDVAGELACEPFELRNDHTAGGTTHPKGTVVLPMSWDNALPTAHVMIDGTTTEFDVPKWNLRPVAPTAPDVAPYDAKLDRTSKKLADKQAELDVWMGRKDEFKKKPEAWESQRDELTTLRDDYAKVVNQLLITQTMYNRFDPAISAAVARANAEHGLTGAARLDPNIVKAMIFHETELGTSGPFLEDVDPRYDHRIMNHFNISQAIDSSGMMYATYLTEKQPAIAARHGITDIIKEWKKAKRRKEILEQQATRTVVEDAELADLVEGSKRSWETWLHAYPGLQDAINDFHASPGAGATPLHQTYEHWIEMMIFELFEKKDHAADWPDAVRRYNGGGPNARNYRDQVLKRAREAADAAKKKKPYSPTR